MHRYAGLAIAAVLALSACSGAVAPSTGPTGGASPDTATAEASPTTRATPVPTALTACIPLCVRPNLTRPGPLHAGPYKTRFFFGGQLVVVIPDDAWTGREDSTGELALEKDNGWAIELWLDVYPIVDPTPTKVEGYDGSAKALVAWVAANPQVKVDHRGPATIGTVTGEVIDFEPAAKAKNLDPDCPTELRPCIGLFGFPQWDGIFGSGGPFKNRLYAADVEWSGAHHAFYAMIWTDTVAIFEDVADQASAIVEAVQLPADVHQ